MIIGESIALEEYQTSAEQSLRATAERAEELEQRLRTGSDGTDLSRLKVTLCWTLVWMGTCCGITFGLLTGGQVRPFIGVLSLLIMVAFFGIMLADELLARPYYQKVTSCLERVAQVKDRISRSKAALAQSRDALMDAEKTLWQLPLAIEAPVSTELDAIAQEMNGMVQLKSGPLHQMKDMLYPVFSLAVTTVGSCAMLEKVCEVLEDHTDFRDSTVLTLCVLGIVITCVIEWFLARWTWSQNGCSVTNTSLWAAPLGILVYPLFMFVAYIIGFLAYWAFVIVVGVAVIGAIIWMLALCAGGG